MEPDFVYALLHLGYQEMKPQSIYRVFGVQNQPIFWVDALDNILVGGNKDQLILLPESFKFDLLNKAKL